MRARDRLLMVALVAACLAPACSEAASDTEERTPPASVEPIAGSEVSRVVLSQEAADRLGIETAPVESGSRGESIPYAAVLYDPEGRTWAYTNPEPLTYVRAEITIAKITGTTAVVTSGPPVGTDVVVVGASELLGTEYEVGEE